MRAYRIDDLPILPLVLISGQRDHIANVQILSGPSRVLAYEGHLQHQELHCFGYFRQSFPGLLANSCIVHGCHVDNLAPRDTKPF